MTGSRVLCLIWDLRTNLRDVLSDLRVPTHDKDEANVLQARAMLLPCVQTLLKDFDSRWGDESVVVRYKGDPSRQPQGSRPEQVMATSLNPRCKMLYGVPDTEYDDVLRAVTQNAADIGMTRDKRRQQGHET